MPLGPLGPLLRFVPLLVAKTLSKVFGLATKTFFGRVPSRDDHKAGMVGLLSLAWLAVVPAIAFPSLAEAMLPVLSGDDALLRATAVGLVLAGGPVVGGLIGRTDNRRERGARLALTAVQGYGYALIIGLLVVALVLVVPVVKASHLLRRLDMQHMPVMITPEAFDDVRDHIVATLRAHDLDVHASDENRVMAALFHALVWVEEKIFWRDMAHQVSHIRGELAHGPLVVELHPTDLAVRGRRADATYAFAVLADTLDDRHVYFSWDDAAQDLEDRIAEARARAADGEPCGDEHIAALSDELRTLRLSPEQWSAIRRQIHRLEADVLRARLGQPAHATAGDADRGM